jgi:hypothetical protein
VTQTQVKRRKAAAIQRLSSVEDHFSMDHTQASVKLAPLDPKYQHLVQEQLELLRKEKFKKFIHFEKKKEDNLNVTELKPTRNLSNYSRRDSFMSNVSH